MRYLLTTRGRFKKTHMLTGRGSFFVTDCGLRFPRTSPELKQSKVVRVRPLKRGDNGYVWSSWKELGVTCEHCLKYEGREPFHRPRKRKEADGRVGDGLSKEGERQAPSQDKPTRRLRPSATTSVTADSGECLGRHDSTSRQERLT